MLSTLIYNAIFFYSIVNFTFPIFDDTKLPITAKFGKDRYEYGRILKEMRTSLYEDVGSKYGLERGDSIDGRNVQHLHKRDYIRKLTKEAKQAEKAVKGLQSMMQHLESKIFSYRLQLEEAEKKLVSGRITLDRYEAQKADI